MGKSRAILRNFIFGIVTLSLSWSCHSIQLSQIGDWRTRNELPRVAEAIDKALVQPDVNPSAKDALSNLKAKIFELQAAEKKLETAMAEWNRVNTELSQLHYEGIDKNGNPYRWSGHTTAEGETDPRWAKAQGDQREASLEASNKRGEVQHAIQNLDPATRSNIDNLLK